MSYVNLKFKNKCLNFDKIKCYDCSYCDSFMEETDPDILQAKDEASEWAEVWRKKVKKKPD